MKAPGGGGPHSTDLPPTYNRVVAPDRCPGKLAWRRGPEPPSQRTSPAFSEALIFDGRIGNDPIRRVPVRYESVLSRRRANRCARRLRLTNRGGFAARGVAPGSSRAPLRLSTVLNSVSSAASVPSHAAALSRRGAPPGSGISRRL